MESLPFQRRIDVEPITDELTELVRMAQSGNRQAQGDLLLRFQDVVMGVGLRRLGNFTEAQELCQEVFVQALIKLHQLRDPSCFAGWIRSIAQRMAINRGMRRSHCVAAEPQAMEANCIDPRTPLTLVLEREEAVQVRAGLRRLRSMDRDTLVAFYIKGQSLVQMSETFDAPLGTIKRRLHTARRRLAEEIDADAVAV